MMKNFIYVLTGVAFLTVMGACSEAPETPMPEVTHQAPIAPVEAQIQPQAPEEDTSDFSEVMNSLVQSLEIWDDLAYPQKLIAVQSIIQVLQEQDGAEISQPAEYYVARADAMLRENPGFPYGLPAMVRFLAVMDYDFKTGQDPDALAREVLGDELYEANKQRLEAKRAESAGA